ncbi:MAG: DNA modification methylase [Flavobacteriaceae bacterium]|jgi:DNA modification methylase|nr:DNA modification methylase [Flavobacteriaceae bacterium]
MRKEKSEREILPPLEWYTVKRKVSDLIPCDFNPRQITEEELNRLKVSLERFNLVEIPAIDIDNVLLAGHQRIAALFLLGRGGEDIDVRIPNRKLTEEEFKEYMLRSNIHNGEFDWSKIEEFFQDIDLEGIGMDVDAFSEFLKENAFVPDEEEGDFDPEPPVEPKSAIGDLFELISSQKGIKHVVLCGDSTLSESYRRILSGEKFNLIVTDPPYNVNYEGGTKERLKIQNDNMSDDEFYSFLYLFYQECFINSELGAPIYVFHADSGGSNFRAALTSAGFKLSQCLVWAKNHIVMGRQDYHWKHEPILYGWKEGASHTWYSDRKQSTILEFDKPQRSEEHPTMKPLDLISYLIKNSSKQKDIVGDSFLGSGSTLIACEMTWRQCRGVELDPRFADVIIRRWIKYMNDNNLSFDIRKNGQKLTQEQIEEISLK